MAVKQLVSDSAAGIFVRQFECFGTEPLHVNNRDERVRQDASDGCVRLKVFEFHHASRLQDAFVLQIRCVRLRY